MSKSFIPLSVPSLNGNEAEYVKECIDTEWVSSAGEYVTLFEKKIADYTGAQFAIACVNGTSALQISLKLAGVKSEDEVIVPSLTFIAPVNAIAYNNATPIFMDSDQYYNIDIPKTIEFLNCKTEIIDGFTYNKLTNNRISAIVPVHIWGNAADLDDLISVCKDKNIAVIEDASESLGTIYSSGVYSGMHTGTIGTLGCVSFNGNKIITTGGGGMILTNDKKLAQKAKYLTTQAKDDPVRYTHNEIGYNFRLTNIQAAIGVAQIEQLDSFLKKKKQIHQQYCDGINEIEGLNIASIPKYADNNHWLNLIIIDSKTYSMNRDNLMNQLESVGIQTRPVWSLNHMQKPYINCQNYKIEKSFELVKNSLCLPSSISLTEDDTSRIVSALNE